MRKFLSSDIAMRIISVILAVIVWIYVVVLIDPPIDITISDIPVIYTNTFTLTNEGFVLSSEKPDDISVKLRGSRSTLAKIRPEYITAFIDLSEISAYGQAGTYTVSLSVRLPYDGVTVVEKKPGSVGISIDQIVTRTFPVTPEIVGVPREGYVVYESTLSQSTVELTGPSQIISSIDKVKATINVADRTDDAVAASSLVFYNSNDDKVTDKNLTAKPDRVDVRGVVLKTKTVPVKVVMSGGAQTHTATLLTNSAVTILAKADAVDRISEIYTKPVNVSAIRTGTTVTAALDVPDGIIVSGGITEVSVKIEVDDNAH